MRDVLIFNDGVSIAELLHVVCEEEGYNVTRTCTVDETLVALRTAPHRLIVLAERDHSSLCPDGPFFEIIRDHPDLYGRHRYIAIHWWSLSEEEIALLDGLGVPRLKGPFTVQQLLDELGQQVYGQRLPQQYGERRALLEAPLPSADRPGRVTYRSVSVCGSHTCGNASDCSIFPCRLGPL